MSLKHGILLLAMALALPLQAGEVFDGASPGQLCGMARALGFGGTTDYREQRNGQWSCASTRRTLIQGEPAGTSDLRYLVFGSEQRAEQLRLELRMRSYRAPQSVLKRFFRYVETLLEKTVHRQVPEGLRRAVLSPAEGEWVVPGYRLRLQKRFDKGSSYDLWFILEPH